MDLQVKDHHVKDHRVKNHHVKDTREQLTVNSCHVNRIIVRTFYLPEWWVMVAIGMTINRMRRSREFMAKEQDPMVSRLEKQFRAVED